MYGIWSLSDHVDCPQKRGVRIMEVEFVSNLVSFGPSGLSAIESCRYYGGRVCMEFGLFWTMWTVRSREVSVLWR